MSTTIFPFAQWLEGTTQPRIPFNDNSLRMEILSKAAIAIESAEPGSPTNGDCYILGSSPSGAQWSVFSEGDVVVYYSGTWYAFEPFTGWFKYSADDSKVYLYDGGWSEFGGGATDRSTVTALSSSSGVVNIDCSLGDYFTLALTENVTSITFSNLPGAGKGASLMLRITQDSTARTVAWPSSFRWAGGVAGSVSTGSGAVDVLAISTFDNGTKWDATLSKARA